MCAYKNCDSFLMYIKNVTFQFPLPTLDLAGLTEQIKMSRSLFRIFASMCGSQDY